MNFCYRCRQVLIVPQLYVGSVEEYVCNILHMRILNLVFIALDGRNCLSQSHLLLIISIIIEVLGSQNIARIQLLLIYRTVFLPAVEGESITDCGTDLNILRNALFLRLCILRETENAEILLCPLFAVVIEVTNASRNPEASLHRYCCTEAHGPHRCL